MCGEEGQTMFHSRFRVHAPSSKSTADFCLLIQIYEEIVNVSALQIAFMLTGIQTNWCHSCVGGGDRETETELLFACVWFICVTVDIMCHMCMWKSEYNFQDPFFLSILGS